MTTQGLSALWVTTDPLRHGLTSVGILRSGEYRSRPPSGIFFASASNEQFGASSIVKSMADQVDSISSSDIVFIESIAASLFGQIDDHLDIVLLEDLVKLSLVLC